MSKLIPILFSTAMVHALLEGNKTMTRRIIKVEANNIYWNPIVVNGYGGYVDDHGNPVKCKYKIGDILWVREKTRTYLDDDFNLITNYATDNYEPIYLVDDGGGQKFNKDGSEKMVPWKPSIFMPKSTCRLFLKIKDIRVERLHEISDDDAISEGIKQFTKDGLLSKFGIEEWKWSDMPRTPKDGFSFLWKLINGSENWDLNPFVWVVSFEKVEKPTE